MIYNFVQFIKENSKNSPIPELYKSNKLGIIMLGLPGSGKSTFAREVILPINRNIKIFSTDNVSLKFTKDVKKYYTGACDLNISYLKNYLSTGQNFIYDATGANDKAIFEINKEIKKHGYDLIFIMILTDVDTAKARNKERGESGGHFVDDDYIDFVKSMQDKTTKEYINLTNPKSFYIVYNNYKKYKYYKHNGLQLLKRKVDKYIPMNYTLAKD